MLYCFVDTNIFLQFRFFDEIDWPAVFDVKSVCLVVPSAVVDELDKHKSDPTSARRKNRARKVLTKIKQYLEAGKPDEEVLIRSGTYLNYMKSPTPEWLQSHNYDPGVPDDRIVGTVHKFQADNPDEEIVFFTDDTGPQLKARSAGLRYIDPPELLRLEDEPDPAQRELQQLRRENEQLKSARPDLSVGFYEQDRLVHDIEPHLRFSSNEINTDETERAVAKIGEEYKYDKSPLDSGVRILKDDELKGITVGEMIEKHYMSQQQADTIAAGVRSYQTQVQEYLEKLRNYFKEKAVFDQYQSWTRQLTVALENGGVVPAEDIDIELHFPDGLFVSDRSERSPKFPGAPPKPGTPEFRALIHGIRMPPLFDVLPPFPQPSLGNAPNMNRSRPNIRKTNSYAVSYHVERIKQNHKKLLSPLYVMFLKPQELPDAIQVDYWVTAANIPSKKEGALVIRLTDSGTSE